MSLRSRLSLFFVGIVVVPVAAASVAVAAFVPRELSARALERLHSAAVTVAAVRSQLLDDATHQVWSVARTLSPHATVSQLEKARAQSGLDFVAIGHNVAVRPSLARSLPSIVVATVRFSNGATLRGGVLAGDDLARLLARASGASIRILSGPKVVGSGGPPLRSHHAMTIASGNLSITLLTAHEHSAAGLILALALIAAAGLTLACGIGFALSKAIARPLVDLALTAEAIARGEYDQRVDESQSGEVGKLGRSFNRMACSVQAYVKELRDSRDELRRTLERLGSTLKSTRGMDEMLRSVLEASAAALGASAGALFRMEEDQALEVEAMIGLEAAQVTRDAAARAVRENRPVLEPALDGLDPFDRVVAAAPLSRGDVLVGAIAVIGHSERQSFGETELSTLASFAAQASVAIDNVFLREEAEHLSLTDSLTGVANRRALEQKLKRELERSIRYGRPIGVLMCDLDHFKSINDRFGHLEGDRVLVEAVRRVSAVVRGGIDIVARYGGEEFVLVLPETSARGSLAVASKICAAMRATPFPVGGGTSMTVSIGVAAVPGDGPTVDDVLHAADLALYRAKQEGRNRFVATVVAEQEALIGGRA